jgi:large subunit ribosomal protein L17
MRHRVDHRKLGRTASHRKAMLANMVTSLFDKERIQTTAPKAKEARRAAERLITRAKKGYAAYKEYESLRDAGKEAEAKQMQANALAHWRMAGRVVRQTSVLKKLFNEIAPHYMEREGGYTRILRLGVRQGDNAQTVMLELVETEKTKKPMMKKGKKAEGAEGAEPAEEKPKAKEKAKKSAKEKEDKKEAKPKKAAKTAKPKKASDKDK